MATHRGLLLVVGRRRGPSLLLQCEMKTAMIDPGLQHIHASRRKMAAGITDHKIVL
jgi:hypothetical protein